MKMPGYTSAIRHAQSHGESLRLDIPVLFHIRHPLELCHLVCGLLMLPHHFRALGVSICNSPDVVRAPGLETLQKGPSQVEKQRKRVVLGTRVTSDKVRVEETPPW